jgi:TfoX/Sxy family transcriptional regulator of competence genes
MARKYLERLTALVGKATSGRFGDIDLQYRHFFSGAALYANGRICLSLTPAGLALRLPEEARTALLNSKGAKPLRYFPQGPIKKDYVVLHETILNDVKELRHWVKLCIESAVSLPGPVRNKGT